MGLVWWISFAVEEEELEMGKGVLVPRNHFFLNLVQGVFWGVFIFLGLLLGLVWRWVDGSWRRMLFLSGLVGYLLYLNVLNN